MNTGDEIQKLREAIDTIEEEILNLINKRLLNVTAIGALKM
jgi:chorismate mutase